MRVLITGANGFLGMNLRQHLSERPDVSVMSIGRASTDEELSDAVAQADFIFHLAGINRPRDLHEFTEGNEVFTTRLCGLLQERIGNTGFKVPVVFSSSIQASQDNPYGKSKRASERALFELANKHDDWPVHVFRLPNVFGKWARPNYNSVVATFCHNISQGLPIEIHDPASQLTLVYVDDVVRRFLQLLDGAEPALHSGGFESVQPEYQTTVGELAEAIRCFRDSRETLITERVGTGFTRALYATYLSYLRPGQFSYQVPQHGDHRGVFVEMLKTPDCGQFSFFTAHPGVTRGGHYHHSKTEKFLVIKGAARFKFRHMQTGETYELFTNGDRAEIVETVPGWTHDITNVGGDELVCMLWANEIFDRDRPDTYHCPV